jgi:hypothetical protein
MFNGLARPMYYEKAGLVTSGKRFLGDPFRW